MRPATFDVYLSLLLMGATSAAQDNKPVGGAERSAWYMYFGDQPVSEHWALHLEGQYRREGLGQRWEQLVVRPGVKRTFPHGSSGMIAYSYMRGYPFEGGSLGAPTTTGPQPEHRLLEEFQVKHRLLGDGQTAVRLSHRMRLEQRWQGTATLGVGVTSWKFTERARYRLTANIPFRWSTAGARPDYASLYNEVFVNVGPGSSRAFNQNRTYGALGWNLGKYWQVEAGYMYQYQPTPNGIIGVSNHALQFAVNSTAPFRRILHKARP